jgi:hypothetical protein
MVDQLWGRPSLAQNVDIFGTAPLAPAIVVDFRLIIIPPAGNGVYSEASAAQLIQCCELARRGSEGDETRALASRRESRSVTLAAWAPTMKLSGASEKQPIRTLSQPASS